MPHSDRADVPAAAASLTAVSARPNIYGIRTLDDAMMFIMGYNFARGGGPLDGFTDWVCAFSSKGRSLHWMAHVRDVVTTAVEEEFGPAVEDRGRRETTAFFELLFRYFDDRSLV